MPLCPPGAPAGGAPLRRAASCVRACVHTLRADAPYARPAEENYEDGAQQQHHRNEAEYGGHFADFKNHDHVRAAAARAVDLVTLQGNERSDAGTKLEVGKCRCQSCTLTPVVMLSLDDSWLETRARPLPRAPPGSRWSHLSYHIMLGVEGLERFVSTIIVRRLAALIGEDAHGPGCAAREVNDLWRVRACVRRCVRAFVRSCVRALACTYD